MTRRLVTMLVTLGIVGTLTSGCGLATRHTSQEVLDRVAPGQARVIDSEYSFGQGYHHVTAALNDDPDAVVRFGMGSQDGSCDPGSECERGIRDAVLRARTEAAELRTLTGAFRDCGHPVLGFQSLVVNRADGAVTVAHLFVAATVDDATVTPLTTELDRCIAAWQSAPRSTPLRAVSLSLDIVDPAVAATAPAPDEDLPTMARLDSDDLLTALTDRSRYTASVTAAPGAPAVPIASVLRPELIFDDQQAFDRQVLDAVQPIAAGAGASGPVSYVDNDSTRFVPGTTRSLDVVVPLPGAGGTGFGPTSLIVTVDRDGGRARDPIVVTNRYDATGTLIPPTRPR